MSLGGVITSGIQLVAGLGFAKIGLEMVDKTAKMAGAKTKQKKKLNEKKGISGRVLNNILR